MRDRKYKIVDAFSGMTIAAGIDLNIALDLIYALMEKYYNEKNLGYSIVVDKEYEDAKVY